MTAAATNAAAVASAETPALRVLRKFPILTPVLRQK
jgi:hypothetical protein